MCNCTSEVRIFDAPRNDIEELLPVIGQYLCAGLAEAGAIFLEAGQHDLVAIIHVGAAEPRNVPRAGIVSLLRRRGRSHQDKWNNEKKSGHGAAPTDHDLKAF
jgi:hypothetical protein